MLSQIRLGNSIGPTHPDKSSGSIDSLKGFSIKSMRDMETYFENEGFNADPNTLYTMVGILLNVIVNGDFDENDKTDYILKFTIKVPNIK